VGVLALGLVGAFWWVLIQQADFQNQPGGATTALPIEGYPAPELPAEPSQTPVEAALAPTPTLLPQVGFQVSDARLLSDTPELLFPSARSPRFIRPATDGITLVGEVITSVGNPFAGHIVSIDLASGTVQKVVDVSDIAFPQVSSQYIVWIEQAKLHFYHRISGKQGTIEIGEAARNPSLSGSIVVWEYTEHLQTSGERGIWSYDLDSGVDLPVVLGAMSEPLISGHWVIYMNRDDYDEITVGLYGINLETGENFYIGRLQKPTQFYLPSMFALDAPWVVWSEGYASEKPELHLFNLDTRQTMTVPISECSLNSPSARPDRPVISGSTVLFRGCSQTLGYDIDSGALFSVPISQVPSQPASFVGWDFAGGQLTWVSVLDPRGEGKTEVWTVAMPPGELVQSPPPLPTSLATPLAAPTLAGSVDAYP
jgi:hypothetical protein